MFRVCSSASCDVDSETVSRLLRSFLLRLSACVFVWVFGFCGGAGFSSHGSAILSCYVVLRRQLQELAVRHRADQYYAPFFLVSQKKEKQKPPTATAVVVVAPSALEEEEEVVAVVVGGRNKSGQRQWRTDSFFTR